MNDNFYKTMMDNLYDGVYFVDRDRRINYWNKGAERITGYSSNKMVGTCCNLNMLNHVDDNGRHLCDDGCPLAATILDGQPHEAEVYLSHAQGYRVPVLVRVAPIFDQDQNVVGAVEVFSNNLAAFQMRRKVNQLEQNVLADPLTNIGNRAHGELKINAALEEYKLNAAPFALLFFDIDHFKAVNDTYGHNIGDKVLQNVANTLKSNLRGTDTCARWGGEEFVALIFDVNEDILLSIANKLRALIAESTLKDEEHPLRVTVSIGGALVKPGDDLASLVARADALMYKSKAEGRNRVSVE